MCSASPLVCLEKFPFSFLQKGFGGTSPSTVPNTSIFTNIHYLFSKSLIFTFISLSISNSSNSVLEEFDIDKGINLSL